MQISFTSGAPAKSGVLIIPMREDEAAGALFREIDEKAGGALTRAVKTRGFEGKAGEKLTLPAPGDLPNGHVVIVGAGKRKDFGALEAQRFGGVGVLAAIETREKAAAFLLEGLRSAKIDDAAIAAHVAHGARLGAYRFDKYRTKEDKKQKPALEKIVVNSAAKDAKKLHEDLSKRAEGVFITRDLVSEPANILYPEEFADRCKQLSKTGLKIKVLNENDMKKLGMGSLLGVGQGSARESRLVAMEWMGGTKGEAPIAFVGKGVTFDTGGISIKPAPGMEEMKWDMGGAGAVTGAMAAIAGRKAKKNVVGVVGLVENMPDGNAQRPGDVVTSMSGQTIEVLNTDAEGRLVLADALWWTQETYKPDTVIDLATLTGAILIALAHEFAGLFTVNEKLAKELIAAGEASGDKLWRMPLTKAHDEAIKSDIADMQNIGKDRFAGSSTAAAFLQRFIQDDVAWAHLDIAGMAWAKTDKPTCPKGGTGYGVAALDEFVKGRES